MDLVSFENSSSKRMWLYLWAKNENLEQCQVIFTNKWCKKCFITWDSNTFPRNLCLPIPQATFTVPEIPRWYPSSMAAWNGWAEPVPQPHELAAPVNHVPMEHSKASIIFLETKVSINNATGCLETDLYSKPTVSHNYLLYNSAHPKKCKDSIPYSQFLRIIRICSKPEDYDRHIITLSGHFLRRGYPNGCNLGQKTW